MSLSFPNVPYKPIFGSLKLAITTPETKITATTTDHGPDLSSAVNFKLPKGFSITEDPKEVNAAQNERVSLQHLAILKKRDTCGACKQATSEHMLEISQGVLDTTCTTLSAVGVIVKVTFAQDKDGSLVSLFEVDKKTLGVKVTSNSVEVGYFVPNGINSEKKFRLDRFKIDDHLMWLEK